MSKPKKLRTYVVPTIIHCTFGAELLVTARNEKEAKAKILTGEGIMRDGEGYDWDRFTEHRFEIGDWREIEEET